MKFKANEAASRKSQASTPATNQASGQPPSPSVPLSVYRELAAELQATRGMVDSLNVKNQDLTLQNQKLRQEIYRFAQSAIALQSLVAPTQLPVSSPRTAHHPEPIDRHPSWEDAAAASAIAAKLRGNDSTVSYEELSAGVQELPQLPQEKKPRNLGGIWLTLTIVLIMVTAFGAGFLVVRPLLPTSNK